MSSFTPKEISALHSTKKSLWVIVNDKVYDITSILKTHPGGQKILVENAGKDCTELFNKARHNENVLDKYYIGIVDYDDKCSCTIS